MTGVRLRHLPGLYRGQSGQSSQLGEGIPRAPSQPGQQVYQGITTS